MDEEKIKAKIIDGQAIASIILAELHAKVQMIKTRYDVVPTLAIILASDDPASEIYVKNKIKAADHIGINAVKIKLSNNVTNDEILHLIEELNNNQTISGIITQLPLPAHIDKQQILATISPDKDVDGFHPINVGHLHNNSEVHFIPCTALGCLELIKSVQPNLSGLNAVIISRSNIVGKPLAALLINNDCTVTICHSKTKNLQSITASSDIVISAMGSGKILGQEYFNSNAIVIDVGIRKIAGSNKITGDVDFNEVAQKVRYITPVPKGVGPMTVACLLSNTLKATLLKFKHH